MTDKQTGSGLTIPCHWNKKIIEQMVRQTKETAGISISEVYGSFADGGPVGHGRSKLSVQSASKQEAIDFRKFLRDIGLNFTYLLNAPFKFTDIKQKEEVDRHIEWILKELQPNAITITSHELMRRVREMDNNINIHISTIAGIRNGKDLEKFLDVKPNRIIPHHDCGKRWADLKEIIKLGKEYEIETELLATESCLFQCPNREAHYIHLANKTNDGEFHKNCNTRKILNPREFLLAGGTIRPEDTEFFEKIGVKYFKITGRSKPAEWLPEVVRAYHERSYDGNLVRLLGIDPSLKAEEWIYIDNKSLNGFIEHFPQTNIHEEEKKICGRVDNKAL
ncbi:MAG: hypothetical protein DDT21_02713 [Syntrophomonadaceae bacterium]|nr:hypothetical protein [Bacillota bacterium]